MNVWAFHPEASPTASRLPQWLGTLAALTERLNGSPETRAAHLHFTDKQEEERRDLEMSRQGDGDAFARMIRRHQPTIARRMTRFSRDPRQIEELVHDVFVEAYFSLGGYRGEAPMEHWLTRIATRVGYRYWKRRRSDREKSVSLAPHGEPAADAPSVTSNLEQADAAEKLAATLDALAPRDRLVVTLLYLDGRSVAEAADLAGWSQTMVKVQAFRARGKLRKILESEPWARELMAREGGST